MYVCLLFFIGTDCKTELVGITIQELAFKQPFTNPLSIEFKDLESSVSEAVSYFKHVFNDWDQLFSSSRF